MDELIFKAKKHEYVLNGKKIPSVSDKIKFLSNMVYGEVDPIALEIAAEKGTMVHEYTVKLEKEKTVECPSSIAGYITGFSKFLSSNDTSTTFSEKAFAYKEEFAGTIDRYMKLDGKDTLLDIKTNSKLTNKNLVVYEAQLNLYRMMLEDNGYNVEQMYILHLMKDGEYKLYEIPIDNTLADMCLYINRRMNERKRRK